MQSHDYHGCTTCAKAKADWQSDRHLRKLAAQAISEQRPQSDRCDPEAPCSYCYVLGDAVLTAIHQDGLDVVERQEI